MTSTDTDADAAAARAALVKTLVEAGDLTSPGWRAAFEKVPRHLFVPFFFDHDGSRIAGDDDSTRERWFAAVHEDRALVTHRTGGTASSSSSQPSLMAAMLEALDVADGMSVLEIGAGTGYNAGLLAHRLGDEKVVTIDVATDITGPAAERLSAAGFHPRVITGDGAAGWPGRAPYDRIIATCRLDHVPPALVAQLAETGFILAPLGSALVRIYRTGPDTAEGRFLPGGAFFMPLRRDGEGGAPARRPTLPTGPNRPSALPAAAVGDNAYRFLASIVEPGLTWQYDLDVDRQIIGARAWAADGSVAALQADGTVAETGPRRIWTALEDAYRMYAIAGSPGSERYGITVEKARQRVWLDSPGGPSWNLSA
ncbi:methyltransferase domain-containing protein [Streptomyces sp. NPDC005180]|uniref:methyltransferase domain-containing protein n=1 Tax=Streptomyces sp. NPDC005180 TaxID=3156868 RepID=UPI0033A707C0